MYNCKICNFKTEKNGLIANHYKYNHKELKSFICDKCTKKYKTYGNFKNHINKCNGLKIKNKKICDKCNFEICNSFNRHYKTCNGRGPRRQRIKLDHAWNKGLTKETDDRVKRQGKCNNGKPHTEEVKLLLSKLMIERYKSGWESTAGRCKKIDYVSKIAGIIKVDGTWELAVAKYLDAKQFTWYRNKKRFHYFNEITNKDATYCPDFYIVEWNSYIEVKGYKTKLDDIKWKQFTEPLIIWMKKDLIDMGIL